MFIFKKHIYIYNLNHTEKKYIVNLGCNATNKVKSKNGNIVKYYYNLK